MIKKRKERAIFVFSAFFLLSGVPSAAAVDISLYDWSFNVDGKLFESVQGSNDERILPSYFDSSGFDWQKGTGSIKITYSPGSSGNHYLLGFFDHEIDRSINTYFNETGTSAGASAPGQTWEIDEPGWKRGDIYENFRANTLDNKTGAGIHGETIFPDDVSMAMGWDFHLTHDDAYAVILFNIDVEAPQRFQLSLIHTDPDSAVDLYLSGDIQTVPVPPTIVLLGSGVLGFLAFRRRPFKR